jgi:hypothetical protein
MEKFFIVGCPRSGTTMVQQGLNRHSAIAIPPETKYFFSLIGHSRECQLRHVARLSADLRIPLAQPSRRIASVAEGRLFYEEMARLYVARLEKRVAWFGEKTPEHTGHLPRLQQFFPDAKIIFLYRDGRDVALSLTKVPWMSRDLNVNFLIWLYYYRILSAARSKPSPNFYFARYEDIVADPTLEFGKMLAFLGLPFEPLVAQGFGNSEGIPEREYAWKARALEKITGSRVGVFRRELNSAQVALLERLGRHALPDLGYGLVQAPGRQLSPGLVFGLAWNFSKLMYHLPWHSLANEFFGRAFLCGRGTGFSSPPTVPEHTPRNFLALGPRRAAMAES